MTEASPPPENKFEVITELMDLWRWGGRNLGVLVRISWPSVILMTFLTVLLAVVAFTALAGAAFLEPPEKGDPDFATIISDVLSSPYFFLGLFAYLATTSLFMFIYAIPVSGATKLALDDEFRKNVGLGYFRFGSQEIRIGLLGILILVLYYGSQIVPQIWILGDMLTMFDDVILSPETVDREVMREFMRLQSLTNGLYLLALLVSAYFIGRLLPAVPIIVSGGPGLGIGAAWRMTRGKGLILLGTIVGAYIGLTVGVLLFLIVLMIACLIVFMTAAAFVETMGDTTAIVLAFAGIAAMFAMIFAYMAFQVGYFQRLQARVYQWLSAPAES